MVNDMKPWGIVHRFNFFLPKRHKNPPFHEDYLFIIDQYAMKSSQTTALEQTLGTLQY